MLRTILFFSVGFIIGQILFWILIAPLMATGFL